MYNMLASSQQAMVFLTAIFNSLSIAFWSHTGKSHTVRKVLQHSQLSRPSTPTVTWINCMSVTSAADVYSQVGAAAAGRRGTDMASLSSCCLDEYCSEPTSNTSSQKLTGLDSSDKPKTVDRSASSNSNHDTVTYQQLVAKLSQQQQTLQHEHLQQARPARPAVKSFRVPRSSKSSSSSSSSLQDTPNQASNNQSAVSSTSRKRRGSTVDLPGPADQAAAVTHHIIVLDEIDHLAKKSQAELVQLFLLPHQPEVQVLLIGIANAIDLTERMLPELKLKMVSPTLICFPAYTSKQLTGILAACAAELPGK
jgi:Cdc6-like AAA superfamily ATPase